MIAGAASKQTDRRQAGCVAAPAEQASPGDQRHTPFDRIPDSGKRFGNAFKQEFRPCMTIVSATPAAPSARMLRQFFELVFCPRRYRVNLAILVAHKVKRGQRNSDRPGTNPQKPADINNHRTVFATVPEMIDFSDPVIIGPIDRCTFQIAGIQFGRGQAHMMSMVHWLSSFLVWINETLQNPFCSLIRNRVPLVLLIAD
jgi:hypothetical protein